MSSSVRNLCLRLLSGGLYSFLCIRGEERKATMFCTQSKSRIVLRFLGNSRRLRLVRVWDEVVDDFLERLASMRNAVFDVFVHFCKSVAGFVVGLETRIPSKTCFSAWHHDLSGTDSLNFTVFLKSWRSFLPGRARVLEDHRPLRQTYTLLAPIYRLKIDFYCVVSCTGFSYKKTGWQACFSKDKPGKMLKKITEASEHSVKSFWFEFFEEPLDIDAGKSSERAKAKCRVFDDDSHVRFFSFFLQMLPRWHAFRARYFFHRALTRKITRCIWRWTIVLQ